MPSTSSIRKLSLTRWLLASVAFAIAACAGREAPLDTPSRPGYAESKAAKERDRAAAKQPALEARELTVVPGGTFGPYVGRSGGTEVLVWATRAEGGRGTWYSLFSNADGKASKPLRLTEAPSQLSLVVVRPATTGDGGGFVVLGVEPTANGATLHTLGLGSQGELQGKSRVLATTKGPIFWVDAVPTSRGALVFWASEVNGLADIHSATLGASAERKQVATAALAWQIAPFSDGAALAMVAQNGARRDVRVLLITGEGKPSGKPVVLRTDALVQLDLDMANFGGHLVVGWSEQGRVEPELFGAALDPTGAVSQAAKRLTAPMGEQALVRLVPPLEGGQVGYALWENLADSKPSERVIQVAPLSKNATLGAPRARLFMYGDAATLPEFHATTAGLAALTQAPYCLKPPAQCDAAELYPTYVEFDHELRVRASEPLRPNTTKGQALELAWGLGCSREGCSALAAPETGPAPIYEVKLEKVSDAFLEAAEKEDASARPRLVANEALVETETLADLATRHTDQGELVAWVTYFDPTLPYERPKVAAPDGRFAPVRALLQTLLVTSKATEPNTISIRARSLGGVTLAKQGPLGSLLGWAAIDNVQPQVFLTSLDQFGARRALKMFTRSPGEVSDVSLLEHGDGWLLAWVDARSGDPEVYTARVAASLQRMGSEERITEAEGAAVDLTMHGLGDRALLVWGDTVGAKQQGFADIFAAQVSLETGKVTDPPKALLKTPGHSHSVSVSGQGNSATIAWLERKAAGAPGHVRVATYVAGSGLEAPPVKLQVEGTELAGLVVDCESETSCHLIVGGQEDGQAKLWGASFAPGKAGTLHPLLTLPGTPSQVPLLALDGKVAYLAAQSAEGQPQLRRLHIEWD